MKHRRTTYFYHRQIKPWSVFFVESENLTKPAKPRQDLVLPFWHIVTQRISDRGGDIIEVICHCQKSSRHHPNAFDMNILTAHHHDNNIKTWYTTQYWYRILFQHTESAQKKKYNYITSKQYYYHWYKKFLTEWSNIRANIQDFPRNRMNWTNNKMQKQATTHNCDRYLPWYYWIDKWWQWYYSTESKIQDQHRWTPLLHKPDPYSN